MKQLTIKQFNGGVSDSLREKSSNGFSIAKHFDIFSDPFKLKPVRSAENADTNETLLALGCRDFLYTSDDKLYFFGRNTVTSYTKAAYKSDFTSQTITTLAFTGAGVFVYGAITEYKGYIWGFQGTNRVFKLKLSDGSFTDAAGTVGTLDTAVIHPKGVIAKDDNLYLAYNNTIVRINAAGTVTDEVLVLPTNLTITSLENYGNYLAIAASQGSDKNAYVFLWDLVSDDVSEAIDWGKGDLKVIGYIDGYLIGVSNKYASSSLGQNKGSLLIKYYDGSTSKIIKEIVAGGTGTVGTFLTNYKAVKNNKLYFYSRFPVTSSVFNDGIWCVGRKNPSSPFAVNLEIIDSTVEATTLGFYGWHSFGEYFIYGYSGGLIRQTNDQATYAETSVYESQELYDDDGKRITVKNLKVFFDSLPASSQVVAKFRKDGTTAWTTLFTHTTASTLSKEYSFIIPSTCDYFQLRLESTGGAVITGYAVQYEQLNSML